MHNPAFTDSLGSSLRDDFEGLGIFKGLTSLNGLLVHRFAVNILRPWFSRAISRGREQIIVDKYNHNEKRRCQPPSYRQNLDTTYPPSQGLSTLIASAISWADPVTRLSRRTGNQKKDLKARHCPPPTALHKSAPFSNPAKATYAV